MSYIVYNVDTTEIYRGKKSVYSPEFGSKGAATRAKNEADAKYPETTFKVAEAVDFYNNIEAQVERTNALNGKTFTERYNAPYATSPSSENYWCS